MAREFTPPMEWDAEGFAPSEDLKKNGFQPKQKPPAGIFNYFFNRMFRGLKELQDASNEDAETLAGKVSNIVDAGGHCGVRQIGSWEENPDDAENPYEVGWYAAAFGNHTRASGNMSFAANSYNQAAGWQSFVAGEGNIADDLQAVFGKYAKETLGAFTTDTIGSVFVIGVGTGDTERANAFRVSGEGRCYGSAAFLASGADYAEYMEWLDGNPCAEDRRGRFVTLEGDKIRIATADDDYILGIVSADPSVVGNTYSDQWHGMYLKDVFGEKLTQTVDVPEKGNECGEIIPAHTEIRFVLNPDYDPKKEYVGRDQRPEWAAVGTHGQLVMVDDGTCEVNGYCKAADGGIATKSEIKTEYRVIKRIDDTHVRVYVK